jgi:hypothetical protein
VISVSTILVPVYVEMGEGRKGERGKEDILP